MVTKLAATTTAASSGATSAASLNALGVSGTDVTSQLQKLSPADLQALEAILLSQTDGVDSGKSSGELAYQALNQGVASSNTPSTPSNALDATSSAIGSSYNTTDTTGTSTQSPAAQLGTVTQKLSDQLGSSQAYTGTSGGDLNASQNSAQQQIFQQQMTMYNNLIQELSKILEEGSSVTNNILSNMGR